jgi:hypothetical protein
LRYVIDKPDSGFADDNVAATDYPNAELITKVRYLQLRLDLALLIDASAFGALGRVRKYRSVCWGISIDGSTGYLAGVVDRYAHPDK